MGFAKLFNRFAKTDKERQTNLNHGHGQCVGDKGKLCQCRILFLDDTDLCLDVKTGAKGHLVLSRVFDYLNLHEKDYFGLRYLDETNQTHWLDPSKTIGAQLKTLPPHTLYFGVKFYAVDPCKLREELTRYQFFLQVKRDILQGRLPVQFDLSVELAALAVQSELGDYDAKRHSLGYVSELRFVPNQSEDFEERVTNIHRTLVGIVPAAAEYRFLDKSKWLDMYGVDLHPVQGEKNLEYFLGLTPTGIVVFRNKSKVGNYFWTRLNKVTFKGKMFMIRVKDKNNDEETFAFECSSKPACKHLWKCCIEHHAFFRLTSSNESYSATGRFLIFGSKHRYSGRTEKQAQAEPANRPPPKVVRRPSKRHQRRRSAESLPNEHYMGRRDQDVVMVGQADSQWRDRGYQSAPDSPRSARSAPWENNRQSRGGLFTSGRSSPTSEYSDRMLFPPRRYESESEGGPKRRNHRSRMDASDSEAEYRARRSACRVPAEYTDASESESEFRKHRKYRKSLENVAPQEHAWNEQQRRIRDGGYQGPFQLRPNGSMTSVVSGESTTSRRRRRRSKSPGNRKPPEELAEHFKYEDPLEAGIPLEQLRDIAYTAVEANTDPKLKAKAHRRARSKSPKNKHNENAERLAVSGSRSAPINAIPPVTNPELEAPPPPYTENTQASTNSLNAKHQNQGQSSYAQRGSDVALHPPLQPTYASQRAYSQHAQPQPQSPYGQNHGHYRVSQPADYSSLQSGAAMPRHDTNTAPVVRSNYAKQTHTSSSSMNSYNQPPPYTVSGQSMYNTQQNLGKPYHEHVREDSGLGIESNPSRSPPNYHYMNGGGRHAYSSHNPPSPLKPSSPPSYQHNSPYHHKSSAQGSPASYNNPYPSNQAPYAGGQQLYVSNQPSYPHNQQYHSHYSEQGSFKSNSHSSGSPYQGPGHAYQQQLKVHNQPPSQYQHGNHRNSTHLSNGAFMNGGHQNLGPNIGMANTRKIYNNNGPSNDNYYGQFRSNTHTKSEKTTDL